MLFLNFKTKQNQTSRKISYRYRKIILMFMIKIETIAKPLLSKSENQNKKQYLIFLL